MSFMLSLLNTVTAMGMGDSRQERLRHELRAVVAAQESRCAALADETREHLDHPRRGDAAVDINRQPSLVNSSVTVRHLSFWHWRNGRTQSRRTIPGSARMAPADAVARPRLACAAP